jgi:hypothetical protein
MPLVSLIFGDRVADSGNRCRFVLARLHNVYRIARTENSPAAQGIDAMHIEAGRSPAAVSDSRPTCKRSTLVDRSLADKQRDGGWRRQKGLVDKYHRLFADHAGAALAGDGRADIEVVEPPSRTGLPSARPTCCRCRTIMWCSRSRRAAACSVLSAQEALSDGFCFDLWRGWHQRPEGWARNAEPDIPPSGRAPGKAVQRPLAASAARADRQARRQAEHLTSTEIPR